MVTAVIDDVEQFKAFLASQPLCRWAAQKELDISAGLVGDGRKTSGASSKKSDNADLAAALSSMA